MCSHLCSNYVLAKCVLIFCCCVWEFSALCSSVVWDGLLWASNAFMEENRRRGNMNERERKESVSLRRCLSLYLRTVSGLTEFLSLKHLILSFSLFILHFTFQLTLYCVFHLIMKSQPTLIKEEQEKEIGTATLQELKRVLVWNALLMLTLFSKLSNCVCDAFAKLFHLFTLLEFTWKQYMILIINIKHYLFMYMYTLKMIAKMVKDCKNATVQTC